MANANHDVGGNRPAFAAILAGLSVYLCAAIGGFIASLADMVQKEEASAVTKLTSLTARFLHVTMEPFRIFGFLVLLATMLYFVFQPADRKQSFIAGMGVIALIMTVTPYKQPLTGAATTALGPSPTGDMRRLLPPLTFMAGNQAFAPSPSEVQTVQLVFNVSNRLPMDAVLGLRVWDPDTGQELYQKVLVRSFQGAVLPFELGSMADTADLFYAIELNGFRLPPQPIDLHSVIDPIDISVANDTVIMGGSGGAATKLPIPPSVSGGPSFSNDVFNKLNGQFRW